MANNESPVSNTVSDSIFWLPIQHLDSNVNILSSMVANDLELTKSNTSMNEIMGNYMFLPKHQFGRETIVVFTTNDIALSYTYVKRPIALIPQISPFAMLKLPSFVIYSA